MQSNGGRQCCRRVKRSQKANDRCTGFEQGLVRCAGRVDDGDQVGFAKNQRAVASHRGAGGGIGLVGCTGRFAGSRFHDDGDALGDERFEALRK